MENEEMHEELYSHQQKERNTKGLAVKQEKAERMQAAMLDFAQAMQAEGADKNAVIKAMALKYPDIAMDLIKKGLKL